MRKRLAAAAVLLLAAAALWYYSTPLLTAYARLFEINDASKGADALIVLGGGVQTRPDYAARLMREGYAPDLLVTSPRPLNTVHPEIFPSETEQAVKVFATYGLTPGVVPSLKGGATSTFDEAYDLAAFIKKRPMRRIIIVTDAFHTSRAAYAFYKVFAAEGLGNVVIETAAAPNPIFSAENWWRTERGFSTYLLEPLKYLYYRFNTANTTQLIED